MLLLVLLALADDPSGDRSAVEKIPGLVAFWTFGKEGGRPRESSATKRPHTLAEVGGPIRRVDGASCSGLSAELNGRQCFRITHEERRDLDLGGTEARQVTPHDSAGVATLDARLYHAVPHTEDGGFTGGIEGPACDREGNVYAVNFKTSGTIGRVTPDGRGEVFVTLPGKSRGNGIRFGRDGLMYVADPIGHKVLKVDLSTRAVSVFAHEPKMSQPNDLAVSPDGTLWASDPDWGKKTGRIWRVGRGGSVSLAAEGLGTTNGIEISPDGRVLYVNETVQRKIWAFDVGQEGRLAGKRLLIEFPDHGFDGMRCDVEGHLYVTRYGKGTVAVVSPNGTLLREIDVLGPSPSNLCFGGPDGKTVYVTEVSRKRLVRFRTETPGAEWARWRSEK